MGFRGRSSWPHLPPNAKLGGGNAKEGLRIQMELLEKNQGLKEEKLSAARQSGPEQYKKQLEKLEEMNKVQLRDERVVQDFGDGGMGRQELKNRETT